MIVFDAWIFVIKEREVIVNKKIEIEKGIFIPTAIILLGVILFGFVFNDFFNTTMTFLFNAVTDWTGWFMMIGSVVMVVACLIVCFTPLASKRVGGPSAKVEYSNFAWISMAICSGIATAVVFYAVGEPITYFHNPPVWWNIDPETPEAVVRAISQSQFHWGFIYYGIFTFWGLIAGYMIYNHNLPPRPSSAFYPLLKDKVFGPIGKVIDVLSLLALIGGMVTSLGFGVQQFASGLDYVFGIKPSNLIYIATLLLVTISYTVSSGRGVKKGMAIISSTNTYIYIFLIAFLFLLGDTVFELKLLTASIGQQIIDFIPNVFSLDPTNEGQGWFQGWTVFYMAWITAYAPLIGCFLAKISKGRSWRSYLLVNIFCPAAFVTVWFVAFGGNAIFQDLFNGASIGAEVAEKGIPIANYALLNLMPLKGLTIPIVVAALFFSFITLADAMTGTIAAITVKRITEDEAPVRIKFFWGILCGVTTFLCLFCLGSTGTTSLQNMSIVYALPIYILTFISLPCLWRMCDGTVDREIKALTPQQRESLANGAPIGPMPQEESTE
ncbi:hypothetical protein D1641_16535 [Colidextribacter sp. OB.20]|nr:BCCT family transporter [Colidextribacter sp. OB.20]NBI11586.1 hypothetical protein [Colidextribacter sp. OB.20]